MNFESIEKEKAKIRRKIAKGILFLPEDIEWSEDVQPSLKEFVFHWYKKLYTLDFLETHDFEEHIFHSPSYTQTNTGKERIFDGLDLTADDFQLALELLSLRHSVNWNFTHPFESFDIKIKEESYRASLLHYSLCKEHGSKLFLRKHSISAYSLSDYTQDPNFLEDCVKKRKNLLICGGTGSGKTSLLNSMLEQTCESDHTIILEDTLEIKSPNQHCTRLLSRQGHANDLKDYMAHAMRMSPDRIILGELRASEAEPFLLAMNSGHKGLMSTIHANSAVDAISRLALLIRLYAQNPLEYSLVVNLVCKNVDYVVYMENKKVKEVIEIFGSEGSQIFYEKKAAPGAAA